MSREKQVNRPAVTVAVVPRERFSVAAQSLDSILPTLGVNDQLVYVDGKSPKPVAQAIAERQREHGFRLIREDRYLTPNEARNLALPHVTTPYVAFVDNDLIVTPEWLDQLVVCAEDTGAWVVGPLYFEGDPANRIVHMAGGELTLTGTWGSRTCATVHRFQGDHLDDLDTRLERERCDFVEFHCLLARMDVFDRLGPLDEGLRNTREHLDLCLKVEAAGGQVWFEPSSEVAALILPAGDDTYSAPPAVASRDVPYFWLRWSDAWTEDSLDHFCATHGIDPTYKKRSSIMRDRRQLVLLPVRRAIEPVVGQRGGALAGNALRRCEPYLNRLIYR
jgi:GT2 family glycosyltransferase